MGQNRALTKAQWSVTLTLIHLKTKDRHKTAHDQRVCGLVLLWMMPSLKEVECMALGEATL